MAKGKDAQKYKLTLSIDPDFARRFSAFSGYTGEDMSVIAARAIRREMRGFSISHRVGDDGQADGAESPAVRLARPGDREAV